MIGEPEDPMRSTSPPEAFLQKLRALPPHEILVVEEFVDFLSQRLQERRLVRAAARLSQRAFLKVWDNPDDAEYDRL